MEALQQRLRPRPEDPQLRQRPLVWEEPVLVFPRSVLRPQSWLPEPRAKRLRPRPSPDSLPAPVAPAQVGEAVPLGVVVSEEAGPLLCPPSRPSKVPRPTMPVSWEPLTKWEGRCSGTLPMPSESTAGEATPR